MEQESLRRFRQKMSIQNKRVFPLLYPGREFPAMELRLERIYEKFCSIFSKASGIRMFSVPGRTELGGNHTDHQHGCVLAAGIHLDSVAAAAKNETKWIRIFSDGYGEYNICLAEKSPRQEETRTPAALIRGVAAYAMEQGYSVGGFDAFISSEVRAGSGLSSSASFEVLVGRIISGLFHQGKLPPEILAKAGQYAENCYFGKACGQMDQMACAQGSVVFMDFENPNRPLIEKIHFDLEQCGYALCLINCGVGHEGLTEEYGAIPHEMKQVANCFGKEFLREVSPDDFFSSIKSVRRKAGDRALLRAIHFFEENSRVQRQVHALKKGSFMEFLQLVRESGNSSFQYLQNIYPSGETFHQEMAVALALCEKLLEGQGAARIHGGGFGGTVQAWIPFERLEFFVSAMEKILGTGCCQVLSIRQAGAVQIV